MNKITKEASHSLHKSLKYCLRSSKRLLMAVLFTVICLQQAKAAYDFSVVVPSGQTLYFNITSNSTYEVEVTYPGSSSSDPYSGYTKPTGYLDIPATITHNGNTYSVTSIDAHAFYGCIGLNVVIIPNSVTSIKNYAFSGCTGLASITIPNSVTSMGLSTFNSCSGLTSVVIPNSVTEIGYGAFGECSNLISVTIGNSVTKIGAYAFMSCSSLTSITIPNSVTTIEKSAFSFCTNLTTLNFDAVNCNDFNEDKNPFNRCPISTINIGDSVQRIPGYFAYNKDSLLSVTIPNSVMSIGNYAFSDCNSLTEVISLATLPPPLGTGAFDSTVIAKVPCGSLSYYTSAACNWPQYFASIEEMCITITVISADENTGTVSGSGDYGYGSTVTIEAIPNAGYQFLQWNDGNTDNPRTITVTENATYTATFELIIGIESVDILDELTFYPNPTHGTISFNSIDIRKVEVLDVNGRVVAIFENSNVIDLSKLSKGYYTMRVTTAEGVAVRKVIKR